MAIDPANGELERFRAGDTGRPFVLVQLLRFVEGGRERYLKYSVAAQPIVRSFGGQVLYAGECVQPLLGGEGQAWDAVVLVRYPNRAAYLDLLADSAYRAIAPQRTSALRDAAVLPMDDWPGR
jgi:uncharacterized protein (DUF1330 family)